MPEEKNQTEMEYFLCTECKGTGYRGSERCATCRGLGSYAVLAGEVLTWERLINAKTATLIRLEAWFITALRVVLAAIALFGLSLGAVRIYDKFSIWSDSGDGLLVLFWIGILGALILFFTFRERVVEQIGAKGKKEGLTDMPTPQAVKGRGSMQRKDVSRVYNRDALLTLFDAWEMAKLENTEILSSRHLFLSLLRHEKVGQLFIRLGIEVSELESSFSSGDGESSQKGSGVIVFSDSVNKLLFTAYAEALSNHRNKVTVLEMLVALIINDAKVQNFLFDREIELRDIRNVVAWINFAELIHQQSRKLSRLGRLKPKGHMNRALTARPTPILDSLSEDLTLKARYRLLPPVVVREKETEGMLRNLQQRDGNVLLVGPSGVGKTTIVHRLAELMAAEEVPTSLQDKRLISLDTASLAGQAEEKLVAVISEVMLAGHIILVIENLPNMVGLGGQTGAGPMDTARILAEVLVHPKVHVVATATQREYDQYLARQASLLRHFRLVRVEEPGLDDAIKITESKVPRLEAEHGVFVSYRAVEAAVTLSKRFITTGNLPSKSIAVLEETVLKVAKEKGGQAIVEKEDVAQVIADLTRIPVASMTEEESAKLLNLEDHIHEYIVNQEEAVKAVSDALRRARTALRDPRRPIATFLFIGPTGVGKTELAKTLAATYFGARDRMIRIDMSEYQEPESVTKLIGAPPGSGGTTVGQLTQAVRNTPFSLVLLDELEKADKEILNIFLQVFEDGRATDASGETIDFTNTIIVATSNAGAQLIVDALRQKKEYKTIKKLIFEEELKKHYSPEFLNRFDGMIVFKPLEMEHVQAIARLMLKDVAGRLEEKGIFFEASDEAVEDLAERGYDTVYGARPMRRVIQKVVDNALAKFMLRGELKRGDIAILEPEGKIRVEKRIVEG